MPISLLILCPHFRVFTRPNSPASVFPDLDKTMQRFLRKPMRVTLATLLGVYRAVMRLSSIARALEDAFGDSHQDGTEAESGPALLRKRIIAPLQQVCGRLSPRWLMRTYARPVVGWMVVPTCVEG